MTADKTENFINYLKKLQKSKIYVKICLKCLKYVESR